MIDYLLCGSSIRGAVEVIEESAFSEGFKTISPGGWRNCVRKERADGLQIIVEYSKDGEAIQVYLGFSPHKLSNQGKHNANQFSYRQAREWIIKTFASVGISGEQISLFRIVKIEFGVNFYSPIDPYLLLDSVILHNNNFFDSKFPHYKESTGRPTNAKNGKKDAYLKIKFYIKGEQQDNAAGLKYHQSGYCPQNTMRFEVKIEKPKLYKPKGIAVFDWSNAESLLTDEAERIISNIILYEYSRVSIFSAYGIEKRELTKPELKHYQNWLRGEKYWQRLDRELLKDKKKYFEDFQERYKQKHPRFYPLNEAVKNEILEAINYQKTPPVLPPNYIGGFHDSNTNKQRGLSAIYNPSRLLMWENRGYFYHSEPKEITPEKRFCKATGIDISNQRKGSKYLREKTLKKIKSENPELFESLKRKHSESNYNSLTEAQQLTQIVKHFRNAESNPRNNRQRFEQRNYPPGQLQLFN